MATEDEVQEELSRYWLQRQPEEVRKSIVDLLATLKKWAGHVTSIGSPDFKANFVKWWGRQDESMAEMAYKQFQAYLNLAGIPADVSASLMGDFKKLGPGLGIIGTLLIVGLFVAAKKITDPLIDGGSQHIRRKVNAYTTPSLVDISALLTNKWRTGQDTVWKRYAAEHGYSPEMIEIIERSARPAFTLSDISALRQMHGWSADRTLAEMYKLGYPERDADDPLTLVTQHVRDLLRPATPIGDILEIERRGQFDKPSFHNELKRHGLPKEMQRWYELLVERLPNLTELQELYRREYISKEVYLKGVKQLGVREDLIEPMASMFETLPDYYLARTLWWRGSYTDDMYLHALEQLGYSSDTALRIKEVSDLRPTPTDLVRFGVREVFSPIIRKRFRLDEDFPRDILKWGQDIGLGEEVLKMHWAGHWNLPATGQGFQMYHRGIITRADLRLLLRAKDVMPFWREKVIHLSYNLIPRRVIPRLVKQELLTFETTVPRFIALGYTPPDAKMMAESAVKQAAETDRELTKGDIVSAFVYGDIVRHQMVEMLKEIGYAPKALALLVQRAEWKRAQYRRREEAKDDKPEADKAREVSKGEVLKGYREGAISAKQARLYLEGIKYSPAAVTYMLALQEFLIVKDIKEHHARQIKRLFDKHVISDTETQVRLIRVGYLDKSAKRLVAAWKIDRKTQAALDAADLRTPTKADVKDWLVKNIISTEEWWQRMKDMHYSERDVTAYYLELVQNLRTK